MSTHTTPAQRENPQRLYGWLDRFLLHLLAMELGYFIFLMVGGVIVGVLVYAIDFPRDSALSAIISKYESSFLWPVLPYIIALPLNMVGGATSIVLNIRTQHQGYPGTGHLLNWIFLMSTAWLFLVAVIVALPGIAGTY